MSLGSLQSDRLIVSHLLSKLTQWKELHNGDVESRRYGVSVGAARTDGKDDLWGHVWRKVRTSKLGQGARIWDQ